MKKKETVLIAAMDWGIGHATRTVPIIRMEIESGNNVILASSGGALNFYRTEFPGIKILEKPAYNVSYYRSISSSISIIIQSPSILLTIIREHFWLKKIIRENKITKVISDNCYGLWNRNVNSTFITHQLSIKFPKAIKFLEPLGRKSVNYFVKKYDECCVPDYEGQNNLSGELSHINNSVSNIRFIGPLSRLKRIDKSDSVRVFEIVILLSGPEPHRTVFEELCEKYLSMGNSNCCIIRGLPLTEDCKENTDRISWFNHLSDDVLTSVLSSAKKIICRSGYSTIMDLNSLNLTAMLIPTPGQTEQEYLAEYNSRNNKFEWIDQKKLSIENFKVNKKEEKLLSV